MNQSPTPTGTADERNAPAQDGQALGSSEIVSRLLSYHEEEAYRLRGRIRELEKEIVWYKDKAAEEEENAKYLRSLASNEGTQRQGESPVR